MQHSNRLSNKTSFIIKWIILLFFLFVSLFPFLWLFLASLKGNNLELQINSFGLPQVWHFENYIEAMQLTDLHYLFLNSIIVASITVILNLIIASMASFVIARTNFPGRNIFYNLILVGVLVPIISFLVPYFQLIRLLKIYDTLQGLIIVYSAINIPVSVFIITEFMRTIPKELEEAAIIDGCTFTQRFMLFVLPLSRFGLVTAGTLGFIYAWNEFIMALLLTSSSSSRTLQLGIRFFTSQFVTDYTAMYAAIIITIIPTILVYIFFHNKIISGLTAGALKG
jgi:raffinose/stachyose/melibiose transport system permease protein